MATKTNNTKTVAKKTNAKAAAKGSRAIKKAVSKAIKDAPKNKALDKALAKAAKKVDNTTADGITHASTIENPCQLVWDLAEKMKGARRKDVIDAAIKKGVAFYTARTQYQLWYTASNAGGGTGHATKASLKRND